MVEIGKVAGTHEPIAFGRPVRRGQMLAVIWSQDLGEKKSELIDALSQQRVDEETLQRLARPAAEGAIPDRTMSDAQRKVEADRVAAARALRTLETWRVPKADIDVLRQEANRLLGTTGPTRDERTQQWAKLELVSPLDGIVVQSNVVLGDLVDTSTDLFQIADLSRLQVLAHAYEEDLPALDDIPPGQHAWTICVGGGPEAITRLGKFDQVGCIIDPNQHTALMMGWVDNADGRLRVGQFITVGMELPPARHEVVDPCDGPAGGSREANGLRAARPGAPAIRPPPDRGDPPLPRPGAGPQPSHARAGQAGRGTAFGGGAGGDHAGRAASAGLVGLQASAAVER